MEGKKREEKSVKYCSLLLFQPPESINMKNIILTIKERPTHKYYTMRQPNLNFEYILHIINDDYLLLFKWRDGSNGSSLINCLWPSFYPLLHPLHSQGTSKPEESKETVEQ